MVQNQLKLRLNPEQEEQLPTITGARRLSFALMKPKSGDFWSFKNAVPWLILGTFAVFWFSFFALTSPLPGGPDVFVFRDAGCNWAGGNGLVAASVPHSNTSHPLPFATYTPGALLLFGVIASIFGCSGVVDTFYNLAWATIAVFLLYRCFSLTVTNTTQRACAAVLLGAVLPTGMVAFDPDRPEIPAFCVLVTILLLWRRASSATARSLLLGCTGLVFLIHPFAGIAGLLLLAFLLVFGEESSGPGKGRLQVLLAGSAVYALILAAWVLSMWWQDHTALHRFLQHAAGQGTGAGVVLHGTKAASSSPNAAVQNGYAVAFRRLFDLAFPASAALATGLVGSGMLLAAYAFRGPERRSLLLQCALLLLVLLIFPFAVFPAQTNYLGISRALLLAVLFIGGFPLATALRGTKAPLCLILVAFAVTAPWAGLETLQNVEARASYRSALNQAVRVHLHFEQLGIHNPALLVDSGHYFLYKPYFSNLYNPNYLEPGDSIAPYQGLLLCYSGSRAFSRAQLPPVIGPAADRWNLIDGGENIVRVTLFGHSIMRRNWTWMCDAYERK
jgi:hypothetical protein